MSQITGVLINQSSLVAASSSTLPPASFRRSASCGADSAIDHTAPACRSLVLTDTHTHTRLTALFPGLPGRAGTRKVKPIWILLKQETVSGAGISWAICKSAPRSRQIGLTTPAPHHSVFLQPGCPSCHPTNSVKALKAHRLVLYKSLFTEKRQQHKNTFTQS